MRHSHTLWCHSSQPANVTMKPNFVLVATLTISAALFILASCKSSYSRSALIHSDPGAQNLHVVDRQIISPNGDRLSIEVGLLSVPENRHIQSRKQISISFIRVPSVNPYATPLFYLPGGPGDAISSSPAHAEYILEPEFWQLIETWGTERDIVFLNQRGNVNAPLSTGLTFRSAAMPLSEEVTKQHRAQYLANALEVAQSALSAAGVELAGYDIFNLIEDLDSVRQTLGYDKINLIGTSFGSQWSLAYISTYPNRVERAILSGVEPLDYTYDSPSDLERALERIFNRANKSAYWKCGEHTENLFDIFKNQVSRLNAKPESVILKSSEGNDYSVLLTGEDLAEVITGLSFESGSRLERTSNAPSLLIDVMQNDLQQLAKAVERKREAYNDQLIWLLIDNSIGISEQRDKRLVAEAEASVLGDINADYRATRNVSATKRADDDFREFAYVETPVLMIQGDMDLSTPMENAIAQLEYLRNGALVIVNGGTHSAFSEIWANDHDIYGAVRSYFHADEKELPKGTLSVVLDEPGTNDHRSCGE